MSIEHFKQQRARGLVYEIAFSKWLQAKRNWYVLPTYDFNGFAQDKAPRLVSGGQKLVVPDILAFRQGKGAWFEIKLKERADLYRATNTRETGLPYRHYKDYTRIAQLTGLPVWVIFIHEKEQVVKTGEIAKLPISHVYDGDKMDRGGTIFFKFDALLTIMTFQSLNDYKQAA